MDHGRIMAGKLTGPWLDHERIMAGSHEDHGWKINWTMAGS